MPPIKIYETLQQSGPVDANASAQGANAAGARFDFLGKEEEMSKKDGQSVLGGSADGKGSPQKSLAIKGPPKIISDKLEIQSYQGIKVTDISVRPIL